MTEEFGLSALVLDRIRAYFKSRADVKTVILYGSRAMGNYRPGSDIDFAIVRAADSRASIGEIQSELDALSTPYFYDVTDYYAITNEALKSHVDRVGKIFYESV